jgi:hypothetical protein
MFGSINVNSKPEVLNVTCVPPQIMSYGFHKFDKEGRPCYIEKTGRIDVNALLRVCWTLSSIYIGIFSL